MEYWNKIYGRATALFRQVTRVTSLEQGKYLPYFDHKDNFPLIWHQAISESPSATSCVSTIQDFLEGSGFSDQELEKKPINTHGQSMFQFHQKVCDDFAEYEGFAVLVRYSAAGAITELENIPFENVRLGKPDDTGYISKIYYNPFFGTADFRTIDDKTTKIFDCYNPAGVASQMESQGMAYKGQILFVGTTTALSRFYPLPEAYSSVKWMKIEAGVSDYHEDNINNGFLQPFMLAMLGNPNEPMGEPVNGTQMTKGQAFDEMVAENFMGAKRVGNMWISWFAQESEIPKPIAFPSNNSGDLFLSVDTQATKKITIAFKVPAILANISEGVSLGGDANQIRVAVKLMQQRVVRSQRILTDAYAMLLAKFDPAYTNEVKIKPYNPYPELEMVDDKIWAEMTTDERRDWILENTAVELDVLADPQPAAPAPEQAAAEIDQAIFKNAIPIGFPEDIRNNIKRSLDYKTKMNIKCGSKIGNMLAEAIVNNNNLGLKHLKRIYSYLRRNKELHGRPFNDGCAVLEYNAWGGRAMEDYLEAKLKDVDLWLNTIN